MASLSVVVLRTASHDREFRLVLSGAISPVQLRPDGRRTCGQTAARCLRARVQTASTAADAATCSRHPSTGATAPRARSRPPPHARAQLRSAAVDCGSKFRFKVQAYIHVNCLHSCRCRRERCLVCSGGLLIPPRHVQSCKICNVN